MPSDHSTPPAIAQARQLFHQGKPEEARAILQRFLLRDMANAEANHSLAVILLQARELDRAHYHARRAVVTDPDDPEHHATLASILDSQGDRESALKSARRASELAASNPYSLIDLIPLFWGLGEFDDALSAAELAMRHDTRAARGPLAHILTHIGEPARAAALLRMELAREPDSPDILLPLVQTLNYLPDTDPRESFELHQRLGGTFAQFSRPRNGGQRSRDPDRRLRVGFLSPDFYSQSVAFFAEPLIQHLDRSRFEVFCYSSTARPDAVTRRLQGRADVWHDIANASHVSALERLDADGLDILIELAGHTTGSVMPLMAARSAPIQVTAIGYPNTTGLPQVDYRLVDEVTDPLESLATERLVRLPGCFLCYRPMDQAPEVQPGQVRSVTFGSFNVVQKISAPVIDTWTRLVNAVPGSRLVLKASQFAAPSIRSRFEERFRAAGLDPARLELLPPIASKADHLALYNRIDIALDPFPYNGTTTTCEALYMGVPVVTLEGAVHAARVGSSLLRAAGLPELVASRPEEYIALATALASDSSRRGELRSGLRRRMLLSPLCDGPGYAARIGTALREMWRGHCVH
jgi:protein O-GlcNAc transferase